MTAPLSPSPAPKLFGTDGIRGVANREPVTPRLALELGGLIAELFRNGEERPLVLMGRDTRLSGPMLEAALTAGLLAAGADVGLLGVVPTPAVAHLVRTRGAVAGVVISASHNPFPDNGLKIFQGNGMKCDDALEARIEEALANPGRLRPPAPVGGGLGRIVPMADAREKYQEAMLAAWVAAFPSGLKGLHGLKIAVDAANGAACETTPAVLQALGAEVVLFHHEPDGTNINRNCGSTYPEVIERLVTATGADLGISHDGDADRVVFSDGKGVALDGDEVLAIIGLHLLERGELNESTLVATVMSNLALDELLAAHGGRVRRAAVGDRAVLEEMTAHELDFGGEQSGHIIFRRHATTGDGLLTALQLLRVIRETGKPLCELRRVLQKYPQTLINLPVRERLPFEKIPGLAEAMAAVEKELDGKGRILLRYSGTEPKVRLLIEAKAGGQLAAFAERILAPLREAIGVAAV